VALLTIAAVVAAPLLIEGGPAAAGAEGAGSVEVEAQTTARIAALITEYDAAAARDGSSGHTGRDRGGRRG
jgi:hypothetical protein